MVLSWPSAWLGQGMQRRPLALVGPYSSNVGLFKRNAYEYRPCCSGSHYENGTAGAGSRICDTGSQMSPLTQACCL